MATRVVPRVGKIHFIENTNTFHASATDVKEDGTYNRVFKALADLATLADAIAFILSIWAPVGGDGLSMSKAPLGDMHALANSIIAKYPSGYIPPAT